jgi:hypothetical protein
MDILQELVKYRAKRSDEVFRHISIYAAYGVPEYADALLELLASDKSDEDVIKALKPLNVEHDTF